jgi:hypothetical protein
VTGAAPIDARALMRAILATPPGCIEETLDRMTAEEQEALHQVFAMIALALDLEPDALGRRRARGGPAGLARPPRRHRWRAR